MNNDLLNQGLSSDEAIKRQEQFGKNELTDKKKVSIINKIFHVISEPMFLLLLIASVIYFILGEPKDGVIMLVFVIVIISIDVIQEWKTDKTLEALKDLSSPHITVIRDNKKIVIPSFDLVPGDVMFISEGVKIPADGKIIKSYNLCVCESSLTGESDDVWKLESDKTTLTDDYFKKDYCYSGTLVTRGSAYILVDKIGLETEYGKISKKVIEAPCYETPLQKQTAKIVQTCFIIAGLLFTLLTIITYFNNSNYRFKDRIIQSILSGITLAMAMIPEEFPVILTVFLSMGAWRLAKKKSLVRKLSAVETLGSITLLCVDKTGTVTKNEMTVSGVWGLKDNVHNIIEIMGMASKREAYDPMERAILDYCYMSGFDENSLFDFTFIKEYGFTNELKMMGHIIKKNNEIIIAVKGAAESILAISNVSKKEEKKIRIKIDKMSKKGMRVIAVGVQKINTMRDIPKNITDCNLSFVGLIYLVDPPREGIKESIALSNKAGIRTIMITGDNGITASAIAKEIGILNYQKIITGPMINKMDDEELKESIREVNIFSRVIPEHKMRIVKAFKANGEVVAMTGDGVNDALSLKYADIGIAMGKHGSEVSREAADLILLDDNFSTIVDTIKDGRRIYDNIRKAIGYVVTVHIPIALASLITPLVTTGNLFFFPLHVVLLELFIDPTCSIILERQPAESNIMDRAPRNVNENILNAKTLIKSVVQGLLIFVAVFGVYYITLKDRNNDALARTMGLSVIILSNLFLVHVGSSEIDSFLVSVKKLTKDKFMWAINIITILVLVIIIYTPLNKFLKLTYLSLKELIVVILLAAITTFWYEIVKLFKRRKRISFIKKKS